MVCGFFYFLPGRSLHDLVLSSGFSSGLMSCLLRLQIIAASKIVEEKQEILQPYNILPLDAAGASQAIMQLPEVNLQAIGLWRII